MPDYKKMYLDLFSDVEEVIERLIEAQRRAEETYLETTEDEELQEKEEQS